MTKPREVTRERPIPTTRGTGRVRLESEPSVKLTKQKNFRLSAQEDRGVQRAARAAGITDSQWLRLVVRAALGETDLLEQLSRASASSPVAQKVHRDKTSKR